MPSRARFTCLWCGKPWTAAGPEALEGWAQLCPDCLGRAGDNGFLRARLRAAIAERGRAASGQGGRVVPEELGPVASPTAAATGMVGPANAATAATPATTSTAAPEHGAEVLADEEPPALDEEGDRFLRRGRYDHGPLENLAWSMELDEATLWLDGRPLAGRIVELAAGSGWWSPLLAAKGELWCYDAAGPSLDRARERLVAHRLRAHLHVRDAWAEPEPPPADALFFGSWLSHVPPPRLAAFLALARGWLRAGGQLAAIDAGPEVLHGPHELRAALVAAGFTDIGIRPTARFFRLISARAV